MWASLLGVGLFAGCVHSAPQKTCEHFKCLYYTYDLDRVKSASQEPIHSHSQESRASYWHEAGLHTLKEKLQWKPTFGVAKNVILFMGDGMSMATITAARIYHGQRSLTDGESSTLSFEKFPITGLSKTYCVDKQVADSACSASAYLTGVKGNYGTIGVTGAVRRQDCAGMSDSANHMDSILKWAQEAGKATGVVTTTRVTHASPAGTYAHTAERDWESDQDVRFFRHDPEQCEDIARQLVYNAPGRDIKVILGGGRQKFLDKSTQDPEYPDWTGDREDEDLIKVWQQDKADRGANASYVWNKDQLFDIDTDKSDYLLGLFEADHMHYHLDADPDTEPTLEEMVNVSLRMLQKEQNGYFLFVEGGKIDLAHHLNYAWRALDETAELSKAIRLATEMTDIQDTLIIVTADHAHTMTFNGYPARGSDILGAGQVSNVDHLRYATLTYANGPGYVAADPGGSRHDIAQDDMGKTDYKFPAMWPMYKETHGGEDVTVYAQGPWAHLFAGNYEQNVLPHMMAFAARMGPSAEVKVTRPSGPPHNGAAPLSLSLVAASLVIGRLVL